ncbi:MAG: hypothetical protein PHC50_08575 [Candidatus Cloacimonetes bacterium]|nr:hypothetical protein [Candidatus Cloacimonadota bacterium]
MTYLILTLFLLILIMLILERYQLLKQIHRQRHLLHELHQCFDVQTEYLSGEIMSYMDIKSAESEAQIKGIQDKLLVIEATPGHGYSRMSDKLDAATEVMRAGLSSHYNTLNFTSQRISRMEELISAWAEEKIKNEAKKGEANRTLRRHLKDARESLEERGAKILEMENEIEEYHRVLAYERAAYKDLRANLCQELSLIKSWLSEHRINTQKLDSYLKTEFKGNIPSHVYRQELDEAALQKSLLRFANDE